MTNYLTQGGIAAIIIYLVLKELLPFLLKMRNGNGSPNNKDGEDRAKEIGGILSDITNLKTSNEELRIAARENQDRIGELAGNVSTLTQLIGRRK